MRKYSIILFALIFTNILLSQPLEISKFPFSDSNINDAQVLKISENNYMLIFLRQQKLYYSKTTDNGLSWSEPVKINDSAFYNSFSALKTNTGRIIIAYWSNQVLKIHSDDNGATWSSPQIISWIFGSLKDLILTQTDDNTIWLTYTKNGLYISKSTDNGDSWTSFRKFSVATEGSYLTINSIASGKLLAVFQGGSTSNQDIFLSKSTDNGTTWSAPIPLINSALNEEKPRIVKSPSGVLRIIYQIQKPTPFPDFKQYDIHYIESLDGGESWSTSFQFTKYVGDDILLSAEVFNDNPMIIFHSKRFSTSREKELTFGFLGITIDSTPPPAIFKIEYSIQSFTSPLKLRVYAYDDNGIAEIKAEISDAGTVKLYDDGLHNDGEAGDFVFGNEINIPNFPNVINVNNISLPLNNRGVLAFVDILVPCFINAWDIDNESVSILENLKFGSSGRFGESTFLYSGGFMLSGYSNDFLWVNQTMGSSYRNDYQPGTVGSNPNDPKNKIYFLRKDDPPFGTSWQNWKDAVALGAYFYDGDNDGIYNPVDKNGNGQWDANEDMPDILGDVTAWCVYNDGFPNRSFYDVPPQGIEIRQTVFASNKPNLNNTIFIRYSILNRGTVAENLDSVYFSVYTDPDIGDYNDDLAGCDTLLNSGYCYNSGDDNEYGLNPPAFFSTILQGPWTYTGNSSDTAFNHRGQILGKQVLVGYKNLNISSFFVYYPIITDPIVPSTRFEARNIMLGYNFNGQLINPCSWGSVVGGVNCAAVNPRFHYSGDPVSNIGWINTSAYDRRMMVNVGPFKLQANNPVDIIVAYTVGRGIDHLNSITVARELTNSVINEYKSNFSTITNFENFGVVIPSEFKLYQNYPNPFNSSTVITYHLPVKDFVTLKIYNILGNEVATLVNEEKPAGIYLVNFNSNLYNLASGVYFYRLTTKNYSDTKKLLLIK